MTSAIYTIQNSGPMSDSWKTMSNFMMSVAMSANVIALFLLFNNVWFPHSLEFIYIRWVAIDKYNFILNVALYTWLPFMLINYLLIYKNKKYETIIEKYHKFYNKKLFAIYFLSSILLPIIYILSSVEIR